MTMVMMIGGNIASCGCHDFIPEYWKKSGHNSHTKNAVP